MKKRKRHQKFRRQNLKQQNNFSMFLVTVVIISILFIVFVSRQRLQNKIDTLSKTQERLELLLEEEKTKQMEIEEFEKYVQTKKYIETIAKEKLGLVYDGEIIFTEK